MKTREIKSVRARWVLDSRSCPTVEATVSTKRFSASAIVPSGASTGTHEAKELRDSGRAFYGKGVDRAVANVNSDIAKRLRGTDVAAQRDIDNAMIELDGTPNKARLGSNAMLSVSLACARLGAMEKGAPLYAYLGGLAKNKKFAMPVPFMNIINGGVHAGSYLDIQELMIAPVGAKNFSEAVRMCSETYHLLKMTLSDKYGRGATNVGDEGGFAPQMKSAAEALDCITAAIRELGYGKKIKLALDAAASELYDEQRGRYVVEGRRMSAGRLAEYYGDLCKTYQIISIEDPFAQEDWDAFAELTRTLGKKVQVVGDDLLVTNAANVAKAAKMRAANALLLKPNQAGTLTEALDAAELALAHNFGVMVSHRSGDSEDSFIADLAVGLGSGQIKSGAPCRGERTAKYNRLLRIEGELKNTPYGGHRF
ncbi:MAG: phosphopyruvate hydratase [Candidatus Diapherotrites archaeon]